MKPVPLRFVLGALMALPGAAAAAPASASLSPFTPKVMPVLVQVNTSGEASKGGFTLDQLREVAPALAAERGLEVRGTMTMAPYEAPEPVLREVFSRCRQAAQLLRDAGLPATEVSMGMSGDYEVAVEEGATMVRLGTILFGERT